MGKKLTCSSFALMLIASVAMAGGSDSFFSRFFKSRGEDKEELLSNGSYLVMGVVKYKYRLMDLSLVRFDKNYYGARANLLKPRAEIYLRFPARNRSKKSATNLLRKISEHSAFGQSVIKANLELEPSDFRKTIRSFDKRTFRVTEILYND